VEYSQPTDQPVAEGRSKLKNRKKVDRRLCIMSPKKDEDKEEADSKKEDDPATKGKKAKTKPTTSATSAKSGAGGVVLDFSGDLRTAPRRGRYVIPYSNLEPGEVGHDLHRAPREGSRPNKRQGRQHKLNAASLSPSTAVWRDEAHDGPDKGPDVQHAELHMLRTEKSKARLKVGVIQSDSSTQDVDLLVDTGGTISIAGAACAGMFHINNIHPVRTVRVETASGTMRLQHAWKGILKLASARIQVTLLLAPSYKGGIIFGTDIQEDLEVNINIAKGYRTITFARVGVEARTNLQTGGVEISSRSFDNKMN
jgi:hypothetical protein